MNYRRGVHTQTTNQMIIQPEGVDSKDKAEKLVGKAVSWKSPAGKEIIGKVSSAHGGNGAIRAVFEKGMPGQAITTKVDIN